MLALAIGLLSINVAATIGDLRSSSIPKQQQLRQVLFVWLVPVVGAALVVYFATETRWKPTPEPPDLAVRDGEFSPSDVDVGSQSSSAHH